MPENQPWLGLGPRTANPDLSLRQERNQWSAIQHHHLQNCDTDTPVTGGQDHGVSPTTYQVFVLGLWWFRFVISFARTHRWFGCKESRWWWNVHEDYRCRGKLAGWLTRADLPDPYYTTEERRYCDVVARKTPYFILGWWSVSFGFVTAACYKASDCNRYYVPYDYFNFIFMLILLSSDWGLAYEVPPALIFMLILLSFSNYLILFFMLSNVSMTRSPWSISAVLFFGSAYYSWAKKSST